MMVQTDSCLVTDTISDTTLDVCALVQDSKIHDSSTPKDWWQTHVILARHDCQSSTS
jgi:hypothetical protein